MRPGIRIGKPLDFTRYQGMEHDRFVLRAVTDEVMYEIMKLSGQEYVDMYATAMKRQLAEAAKAEKEAEKAEREAEKAHRAAVARADKEQAEKLRAAMEQADRKETGDRPSGSRARHAPGEWGNMARRDTVMRMSVEQPLWRALTGYRVLTMIYAIGLFASAHDEFTRPWLAVAYFAVLGAWTLATLPRVASAAACTKPFLAADLTVALTGILLTPVADAAERVHDGGPTLPSIWTASARCSPSPSRAAGAGRPSPPPWSPSPTWSSAATRPATPCTTSSSSGSPPSPSATSSRSPAPPSAPSPAPWRSRPPPGNGNGSPGTSTTVCSRCWRWCSGAAPSSAARRPSWGGW